MGASCLCENSQQDTGLQAAQITVLNRPSPCRIYLRAVRKGCCCYSDSLTSDIKSALGSHVSLRTCGAMLLVEAAAAFEVSLWPGLEGKWPRDAICITSAIISAVWELINGCVGIIRTLRHSTTEAHFAPLKQT